MSTMFIAMTYLLHIVVLINWISSVDARSQHSIHILEDLPIGTSIHTFTTDGCPTETSTGTYRFVDNQKNIHDYFLIDPYTGRVTSRKLIDREEFCHRRLCSCMQCEITLEVLCVYSGKIFFNDIRIIIDDQNDHAPVFPTSIIDIDVLENVPIGYFIPIDVAIDMDYGKNSIQDYVLIEDNSINRIQQAFQVEYSKKNDLLALRLMKVLDRELLSSLEYHLQASDGGQPQARTGRLTIRIHILDVNDMSPVFDHADLRIVVSESTTIGTVIARVHASDRDIGMNSLINYTLVSVEPISNGRFELAVQTGELRLNQPLDYEREQVFRLKIKAQDNGPQQGSLPAYTTIRIDVNDENDNYPLITVTFNDDPLSGVEHPINTSILRVRENAANGTFLVGHLELITK
jgi:hypothetical protein